MKNKTTIIIFVFNIFLFYSCKNSDPISNNQINSVQDTSFKYPFSIGSFWYYTSKNFLYNIRPDSIRHYFTTDTLVGYGNAIFRADTILNNVAARILKNDHGSEGHSHSNREYFIQTDTGLVRIANRIEAAIFGPSVPIRNDLRLSYNGRTFNSFNELLYFYNNDLKENSGGITFDNPPLVSLKYPLVKNTQWLFTDDGTNKIYKKYLGFENVTLQSGQYYCMKIQRLFHFNHSPTPDPNIFFYDYFSKEGMIKRDFAIINVVINNSSGVVIGYVDVKEEDFLNFYTHP